MPRIPQYNQQESIRQGESIQVRQLPTEAPAIRIDASSYAHEARAASQLGVTISNIAEDIIKVKADQEFAKAKIAGYQGLQQIEADASQDDDFQNFETNYSKKIKDLQDNISKTIRSPLAKQQFNDDFALKSTYSFYNISADARKRFMNYDKDLMAQEITTTEDRIFSATTPQEKENAKAELASIFSRRVENKTLNKAEATNLYKKELMGLDEKQTEYDILRNPIYTLGELQKGKEGAYKNLAQDKRIDLIKQAESRIEKLKNQQEETIAIAQNQKESELIDLKIAGTLTEQQVKVERDAKTISAQFADSMISALRNPKIDIKSKDEVYIDFQNKVMDLQAKGKKATLQENAKLIVDVLKAHSKGLLDTDDVKRILKDRNIIIQKQLENETNIILSKSNPKNIWQKLSIWSDEYASQRPEIKARMYRKLIDGITQGGDAAEVLNKIISDELDNHLSEQAKYPNRHYVIHPQTKQRIYSDDGDITWHDAKTGELIK